MDYMGIRYTEFLRWACKKLQPHHLNYFFGNKELYGKYQEIEKSLETFYFANNEKMFIKELKRMVQILQKVSTRKN